MKAVLSSFLSMLRSCLRTRAIMQIEILALRHQLAVLQRRTKKRPSLRTVDRLLWVLLSRVWAQWRSALVIVKPETVIAWQRKGFRLYWRWKSRGGKSGRPCVSREIRELIRQMSTANPLWPKRFPGIAHRVICCRIAIVFMEQHFVSEFGNGHPRSADSTEIPVAKPVCGAFHRLAAKDRKSVV